MRREGNLSILNQDIPTAKTLDTKWLRSVAPQFSARSVKVGPLGTGQLADTYRLELESDDEGAPASLVCKIASADDASRQIANSWSLYEREVRFYRELAPSAHVETPRVHASGLAEDGTFFLLMEDLSNAAPGNQLAGMSPADAQAAMRQAARLHASFWDRGGDPALTWLETGLQAQAFYAPDVFRGVWPDFRSRYADLLSDQHRSVCQQFAELYHFYSKPLRRPRCVVHNDFRPDNMLFAPDRLVVIDWQSAALGFNALDVAYMIGGGFAPEDRREQEVTLLDTYLAELAALGVADYTRNDLAEDYRLFSFAGIVVAVCAAMLVKRTERGDNMFLTMLDRHVQHVIDARGLELLGERGEQ